MDILNVQSLIAQGLITDVASVDPNKAYVAVGVFQPGNRQAGAAGNAYPSYAMPISEFLTGGGGVIGSGTVNYIPKWTPNGTTLGNSIMYEDAGKIGIGTITPAEKLNVVGTVRTDFTALGYTPAYTIFNNGAAAAEFGYNTTYGAIINANSGILALNPVSGNVGIGTTFSNAKLSFGGFYNTTGTPTSNEQTSHIKLYEGGGSYYGFGMSYNTKAVLTIAANSNVGNIGFYTNSLQRALIDENGNFGIGTASPTAKVYILQNTVGTGAKGLSVNFATIGETFYIDDNGYAKYYGGGFTVAGSNGILNIVSNGGVSPSINFQYNNGASTSGFLYGVGASMFFETPALGLGTTYFNPQARLHIKGVDSTSSNYTLKIDNSASSNGYLFSVSNVGRIISGYDPSLLNTTNWGHTFAAPTGSLNAFSIGTTGLTQSLFSVNVDGSFAIGHLASSVSQFQGNGVDLFSFNGSVSQSVGINIIGVSASLHIQGSDSTSVNYALKVDDSASSPLLYVRNDGNIGIGTATPTAKLDVNGANGVTSLFQSNASSITGYAGKFYANSVNTQSNVGIYVTALNGFQNYSIYADEGNSGFGGLDANSKIYVKGIDATSSNYALKVDNSAFSPLLYVRNDGNVGIGITPSLSDTKLEIKVATDQRFLFRNFTYPSIGAALTLQAINNIASDVVNVVTLGLDWYHLSRNNLFSTNNIIIPTAKVHIIGNNLGYDLYALKVDNLGLNPLFYVRNDGLISAPSLPTSNAGLSTGNLYVDTAANILANGDKVVGWKV